MGGLVVVAGAGYAQIPARAAELVPSGSPSLWSGIGVGRFLIFYAFIGCEDLVNIAEEVESPRQDLS